jgi:hypothetical protein
MSEVHMEVSASLGIPVHSPTWRGPLASQQSTQRKRQRTLTMS